MATKKLLDLQRGAASHGLGREQLAAKMDFIYAALIYRGADSAISRRFGASLRDEAEEMALLAAKEWFGPWPFDGEQANEAMWLWRQLSGADVPHLLAAEYGMRDGRHGDMELTPAGVSPSERRAMLLDKRWREVFDLRALLAQKEALLSIPPGVNDTVVGAVQEQAGGE